MLSITKSEYKKARRLIRDNGNYALRWLSEDAKSVMTALREQGSDKLKVRKDVVDYCNREGYEYTFIDLADRRD